MSSNKPLNTLITVLVFCSYIVNVFESSEARLRVNFYYGSCPSAESIVKEEVMRNSGVAAGLLRLHFHDCFVRGCDGSVLIDSTPSNTAEKDSPLNNPSLRGFDVIDKAKTRIEAECPGVVSCADIIAFAARDSVETTGGVGYDVPAGRRDDSVSLASDALINLPFPTLNLSRLTQSFKSKGLTRDEMVTLSGAHTLGLSHCTTIVKRLYNFSANASQDPTLDPTYAAKLKRKCPQNPKASLVVRMDTSSPNVFDVSYYSGVLSNKGLFATDQALLTSRKTRDQVVQNAVGPFTWNTKFAAAMVKMGKIGVVTGSAGEIRQNCRVIN